MSTTCNTLKKANVEPLEGTPYLICCWFDRSSTLSIGDTILSTVRKAARLAVYDEIMINVKNHHIHATIRVDMDLGAISQPTCETNVRKHTLISRALSE